MEETADYCFFIMNAGFKNQRELVAFKKRMRKVAYAYVKKLKRDKHVLGIAFNGSIVHGRVRPTSDIDIQCFYEYDFFSSHIQGKKEFYDIKDKSGFLVQISNCPIGKLDTNIFSELLRNSPDSWPTYKNRYLMLFPVYDPTGRIAVLKKGMSKVYEEELAFLLPEYLNRVALLCANLKKFNSVSQTTLKEYRKDELAVEAIKLSIYSTYIANRKIPSYNNPRIELDLFSLKKRPFSFSVLAGKSQDNYHSLAIKISDETIKMFVPLAENLCKKMGMAPPILPIDKNTRKLEDEYSIIGHYADYAKEALFQAYEANLGLFDRRILLKKKCLNEYYQFFGRDKIYEALSINTLKKGINKLVPLLNNSDNKNNIDKEKIKTELADVLYKKAQLPFIKMEERIKSAEEAIRIRFRIKNFKIDEDWLRKEIEKNELLIYEEESKGKSARAIKKYITCLKNYLKKTHKESAEYTKKSHFIQIKNVVFLKENKSVSSLFKTGEQMSIRIDYNSIKEIKNPVFGIAFYSEDGIHISGPNTKFSGFRIRSAKGRGSIFYRIKKIPFVKGRYFITVAVHPYNSFEPYDVHVKEYSFRVVDSPAGFGLIHLDSEWSILKY